MFVVISILFNAFISCIISTVISVCTFVIGFAFTKDISFMLLSVVPQVTLISLPVAEIVLTYKDISMHIRSKKIAKLQEELRKKQEVEEFVNSRDEDNTTSL